MTHDFIKMSLLDPEQGQHAKTACTDLQDLLAHGTAREIAQKEKDVEALHVKDSVVVAYPIWKRFTELLQKNLPAGSETIAGFVVSPDIIEPCMKEVCRLADDPDLKPAAILFQKVSREGKWLLQTVPREDV
jgi:hypothetical protein